MNIDYAEINSRVLNLLLGAKKHLNSIPSELKTIVELRVSQINGCAYCIDLHSTEARSMGIPQQKLDLLSVSKESDAFTVAEKTAISWAESVTNISTETDIEGKLADLLNHFNEAEIVDVTLAISIMNCMNRMAISFGDKPMVATN
jgi:AhpD family alkylhydroperoxidase